MESADRSGRFWRWRPRLSRCPVQTQSQLPVGDAQYRADRVLCLFDKAGATPSSTRRLMSRAVPHSNTKLARLITSPTIGSANGKPNQIPDDPQHGSQEVMPSVGIWTPEGSTSIHFLTAHTSARSPSARLLRFRPA